MGKFISHLGRLLTADPLHVLHSNTGNLALAAQGHAGLAGTDRLAAERGGLQALAWEAALGFIPGKAPLPG